MRHLSIKVKLTAAMGHKKTKTSGPTRCGLVREKHPASKQCCLGGILFGAKTHMAVGQNPGTLVNIPF